MQKITPFYSNKRTVGKLTFEEWMFTLFAGFVLQSFINSILYFFSLKTGLIYVGFFLFTIITDIFLIVIKGKEENFLNVFIANFKIPEKIEGSFPSRSPVTRLNSDDHLFPFKK